MALIYPQAVAEDTTDELAGVCFPDPYRWLEEESERVLRWQTAQARLAESEVREWPHYERLREWVSRFNTDRRVPLPHYAAGRWFRTEHTRGATHAELVVSEEPFGAGRALFHPGTENATHPPFLSWIAPAPDGRTVALGLCADGSEKNTIRLIDVESGRLIAHPPTQPLMDNWTGGAHWLPDSSGFFFAGIAGSSIEFAPVVYLHRRVPGPSTVALDIPWTKTRDYRMVVVAPDGRHAVAIERLQNPIPIAVASLAEDPLRWRPFITSTERTVAGHLIGDRYVAMTDVGAARGRVVSIALDTEDPNDPQNWSEVVPESDAVLRTITPVADALYLSEFVDTYSRIRIVDLHGRGLGRVALPGVGAVNEFSFPIMNLIPKAHGGRFLFGFSTLVSAPGVYSHTPGEAQVKTLKEPQVRLENAVIEDHWARSADGTHIPYHLVRPAHVSPSVPQPTLIFAYGGFNVPRPPEFPGAMAAFVHAGGVFVHAHLRGGGEFGLKWWQGGSMKNKENCYRDLFAVAEDLIVNGRSSPRLLAVTGGSNGGLMAGVAVTQRPDLWAVVVPRAPMLDLIGACREPYGRMCVKMEYADVDDPEEVRRLAQFSPYHLVRDGVRYPAVFLDAGATDPRCPPWHARKFAARLQKASSGSAPILMHVWENVGHGWATAKSVAVEEHTEWLAFTLRNLGVEWRDPCPAE